MVFQDIANENNENAKSQGLKVAPVGDRLLAFFFDFFLFSPIFSLLLSPLFKKVEIRYYTSPDSTEFVVLLGIGVLAVAMLTILAQAIAITYWRTTPGKYIFKLKVISTINNPEKINFSQALLRSTVWVFELFLLGIPFIEIFSHQHRKTLHDRAADTMVVTLKVKSDKGPHPLETHFVRNLLSIIVCMVLLWGTMIVSQFYRMALRGDFKKSELDDEQYLCASISQYAGKNMNRLDFALARYLAGEIDDECLHSEADFALWTEDSNSRAWAYLTKGFYYQSDLKKSEEYLQHVCQAEKNGEPCRIATALYRKNNHELARSANSITSQILSLYEYEAQGDQKKLLKKFSDLTKKYSGFERFSQKETVKSLWALNKQEQALGAYLNSWQYMGAQDQIEISSWLCLEQVDENCENRNYSACDDLKSEIEDNQFKNINAQAVIGLVKERECKHSAEPSILAFHSILEEHADLRDYVQAISHETNWSSEKRLETLRRLSFANNDEELSISKLLGRDNDISSLIQNRALMALLERSYHSEDFAKALSYLSSMQYRDWGWDKLAKKLIVNAHRQGLFKNEQMLLGQISDPELRSWMTGQIKSYQRMPASIKDGGK